MKPNNGAMRVKVLCFCLPGILAALFVVPLKVPPTSYAKGACLNNLCFIDVAKQQWGLAHTNNANRNSALSPQDLFPYLPYANPSDGLREVFTCPDGGVYTIGRVGEKPRCSLGGPDHTLVGRKK
jgi:hypothetical protein